MRVIINGITYEGTPQEIRDIVENPPVRNGGSQHADCPDNDRFNDPPHTVYPIYPVYPAYPYPTLPDPVYPTNPADITWTFYKRNWDGSPAITCCA